MFFLWVSNERYHRSESVRYVGPKAWKKYTNTCKRIEFTPFGIRNSGFDLGIQHSQYSQILKVSRTYKNVITPKQIQKGKSLSTPACRSQSKIKTTGHTAACSTLIISCKSIINHSLTFPKTWGIGPKGKKNTSN